MNKFSLVTFRVDLTQQCIFFMHLNEKQCSLNALFISNNFLSTRILQSISFKTFFFTEVKSRNVIKFPFFVLLFIFCLLIFLVRCFYFLGCILCRHISLFCAYNFVNYRPATRRFCERDTVFHITQLEKTFRHQSKYTVFNYIYGVSAYEFHNKKRDSVR